MKVVVLCGGLGTRLAEETEIKPKPLVEVGGRPILWHILQHYGYHGVTESVLALGYKGEVIKRYFLDYFHLSSNLTLQLGSGKVEVHDQTRDKWRVHLIDTGIQTQTGGRLKRLEQHVGNETFCMTYGDGVCNVDLQRVIAFHRAHGKLATVTAVRPPARFGGLVFDGDFIKEFTEKPQIGEGWINGGYFVFEPGVLEYLKGDETVLEREPLERLAQDRQLVAYRHPDFWQCMDTLRDQRLLESLWQSGKAPWKVWS